MMERRTGTQLPTRFKQLLFRRCQMKQQLRGLGFLLSLPRQREGMTTAIGQRLSAGPGG